jgi:hypothetical protein
MNAKPLVYLGLFIGSTIGGSVPMLWGDGVFSMSSVLRGGAGGIVGIWLGFKLSQW